MGDETKKALPRKYFQGTPLYLLLSKHRPVSFEQFLADLLLEGVMIHVFQQEAALEGFGFVGVPWVSVGVQDVHQFAFPEEGELLPQGELRVGGGFAQFFYFHDTI